MSTMGLRRRERIMEMPDYCRALVKESRTKAACLCIHHDTSVEFGGWAKCANASIPSGRLHAVKNIYLGDCNKCVRENVDTGSPQKAGNNTGARPAQRIPVFRRKADRKTEEERLRFRHLASTSDHIRHYRETKQGQFVEKAPGNHKVGPSTRLLQVHVKGNFQDVSFPDLECEVHSGTEKFTSVRKSSKFHRALLVAHNHNSGDYGPNVRSQMQIMSVVDTGIARPQVIGKAAPVCSEAEILTRKCSKGSRESISSLAQMTMSEQPAEFTAWVPENAIYYRSRSSSAKTPIPKDTQQNMTLQPLQLHTSHLRKSKYPPSLLFHEKQKDQITVKNSRSKDGRVHTRIEFFNMTAPEQQQQQSLAKKEKRARYLEPLSSVSEGKAIDKNATRKSEDHCDLVDYSVDTRHQKQSYSGRLLSGRIKSGTQQVTEQDLQQLAIGRQLASDDNNGTQFVSSHDHGRNRARRRFYHIEKHDSIPSKTMVKSNLCDLQIQPSVSSSALIQHQDNNSGITITPSSSTHYHSPRTRDKEDILEDRHKTTQERVNELVVNCPTVINSSLLASPHKSHSGTNEPEGALSSVERHTVTYPQLRKSGHRKGIHPNSHGKVTNQILLNSHPGRFLPSSKQHGRIKLTHALTERSWDTEGSKTGYRVTLSGSSSNSPDIHHRINDSSRCLVRSRQRRKIQLEKNILGNLSCRKKVEQSSNNVLRAYKKAHRPVKVCLRGTKKKLIDLLRTNSSNSVLDNNSELPELYAE